MDQPLRGFLYFLYVVLTFSTFKFYTTTIILQKKVYCVYFTLKNLKRFKTNEIEGLH